MRASSIIFIHGVGNKPPPHALSRIWLEALAEPRNGNDGFSLRTSDVRDAFVYWADLFYKEPLDESDYESNVESRKQALEASLGEEADYNTFDEWSVDFATKLGVVLDDDDPPISPDDSSYESMLIPRGLKKMFLKAFIKEAHDYLFNANGVRDQIRKRVLNALSGRESQNVVIVGHSLGSVIGYDVLTMSSCPKVDGFLTIGSPLGLSEIQEELNWSRKNAFPEKLIGDWVNIYDQFDLVSRLDPRLANDFKKNGKQVVTDINEQNWGSWRHSATKYLKGANLRTELRRISQRP